MANITELLEDINTAVYGEDVREAIHDAIEQCYEDATGNPSSVSALVQDVTELQTFASNLFTFVETRVTGISVGANQTSGDLSVTLSIPSGYTPVAMTSFQIVNHLLTCYFTRVNLNPSLNTINYLITNRSTVDSWDDLEVHFRVLCIKNFT